MTRPHTFPCVEDFEHPWPCYRKQGHPEDMWHERQRPPAGSTESDTDTKDDLWEKEPSWNYKKADWFKFQNLTDVLCRELDTDNSNDINTSVQQLTDCILQAAKQVIPTGRRKDYKPYRSNHLQCLHDQLTEARKRLEQLPSPEYTFSTTRQGLLLTKKRPRKPASHGKKRLVHSTRRKTHRSSGIWQRPRMTTSSMHQEQSFWRKVPRSSRARRQPTCLQTVSERTAYLISQWRNKQTSD